MVCICFRCCPILLFQKQAGICQYMHLPIYRDDRFSGDFHALAKRTSPPSLQHAQRKYFYRNDRTFVPHRYAYQHLAVMHDQKLAANKPVQIGSLILCVSIILSTVFIKQHSMFDVLTAFIMAGIMYAVVYQANIVTAWRNLHTTAKRRIRQI